MLKQSGLAEPRRAVRVDSHTGIREVAAFTDVDGAPMFMCGHFPPSIPRGGVVICSPFQSEFLRNYRREVLLARALAQRGFAVQRFHYRGTGNSHGDPNELTFESMRQDAVSASNVLLQAAGVESVSFVGTRWGSFVAAASSRYFDGSPVVLWDPIIDASRYFRELFRMRLISDVKHGSGKYRSTAEVARDLEETGSVDILGLSVVDSFYQSSRSLSLDEEMGEAVRPILLIQMDSRPTLRREYVAANEVWSKRGFAIEVDTILQSEAWWFAGGDREAATTRGDPKTLLADALIEKTTEWIVKVMAR